MIFNHPPLPLPYWKSPTPLPCLFWLVFCYLNYYSPFIRIYYYHYCLGENYPDRRATEPVAPQWDSCIWRKYIESLLYDIIQLVYIFCIKDRLKFWLMNLHCVLLFSRLSSMNFSRPNVAQQGRVQWNACCCYCYFCCCCWYFCCCYCCCCSAYYLCFPSIKSLSLLIFCRNPKGKYEFYLVVSCAK